MAPQPGSQPAGLNRRREAARPGGARYPCCQTAKRGGIIREAALYCSAALCSHQVGRACQHVAVLHTDIKLPRFTMINSQLPCGPEGDLPKLRAAQAVAEGAIDDAVVHKVSNSCRGTATESE